MSGRNEQQLSIEERFSLGLDVLLDASSLTALGRETGLSMVALQGLREDFLSAARAGLAQKYGSGGKTAASREGADGELRTALAPRLFELAGEFSAVGRPRRADECFRQAIELDEANAAYRKGHALFLYRHGSLAEAEQQSQAALSLLGADAECLAVVAMARWADGDDEAALRSLEQCCEAGKLPDYLLTTVVDLFFSLGRRTGAAEVVERELALRGEGDDREALYLLADVKQRLGRFDEARSVLLGAIDKWGEEAPYVILLSTIECQHLGRAEEGLARLTRHVAREPRSAGLRLSLSDALRSMGRWGEAEQEALQVVYQNPADIRALGSLLEIYRATGRTERMKTLAEEMLRGDPENLAVRLFLAQALMDEGDFDAVRGELGTLRRTAPESKDVRTLSLFLAFEAGDPEHADGAEEQLVGLLQGPPTLGASLGPVLALARYLRLNGDAPRALRILDALPRRDRASTAVNVERAMALVESGDKAAARGLLEEIWRREPFHGLHGARLANHLFTCHGDREGAREVLRETRRQASWNDEFALGFATATASVGEPGDALQLVYEYFIAEGRPVPSLSYIHQVIGDPATRPELTREQRLAAHAVHLAGAASAKKATVHLEAMRELATDPRERDAVARSEQAVAASAAETT